MLTISSRALSLTTIVVQELSSAKDFLQKLPEYDEEIEGKRKHAEAAGEVGFEFLTSL